MVIVDGGAIRVVNVFAPFTTEQAEAFLSRLGSVTRGPDR
jgi:hypothetical protein